MLLAVLGVHALAETGEIPEHAHTIKIIREDGYFEATCTQPGGHVQTLECAICGASMGKVNITDSPAKGHTFREESFTDQCAGAPGTKQICTVCGYSEIKNPAGGHNWESKHFTGTCSVPDYDYKQCSKCNEIIDKKETPMASEHRYTKNNYEVTRQPTCSLEGEQILHCDCGKATKSLPIPKTAHTYGASVTTPGNCKTSTPEKVTQTCTKCNYVNVVSSTIKHTFVTETKDPTCTEAGYSRVICSVCGAIQSNIPKSALGHSAGPWAKDDANTHSRSCSRCGIKMDSGNHTPHKTNPLCTERVYCSACGYTLVEAGKHGTYVATDSGDDANHDMKCSKCSYVSSRVKHTYTYIDGDCTKGKVCSVCGHRAAGNASHALSSTWTGVVGGHALKCTSSGCTYKVTEDHTWGDWYVAYQPTATTPGTEAARCTKCSAIMTRALPKLSTTTTPQTGTTTESNAGAQETAAPSDNANTQNSAPSASDATNGTQSSVSGTSGSTSGVQSGTSSVSGTTSGTQNSTPAASGTQSGATAGTQGSTPAASGVTGAQVSASAGTTATSDGNIVTVQPSGTVTASNTTTVTGAAVVAAPVAHASTIVAANCADLGRECTWEEFLQGGLLVRVCTICGDVVAVPLFSDATAVQPVFETVAGAVITGVIPEGSQLVLRAANLTDETGAATDAFLAISAAWQLGDEAVQFDGTVQVSLPLVIGEAADSDALVSPTAEFRLVRVDVSSDEARLEEWTDIDYTFEDGVLSFEMEKTGIYLLIPA